MPTFAEPQWVHAIWLVIAFAAALLWLNRRSARALDRLLSPVMQDRLVARPQRRWLAIALIGVSGLFLVFALMRPQWGRHFVKTPRVGAQIMICLDVSKSMLAEDTAPNRLERAKAEIADLLSYLKDDSVGLTAFAGKATVVCPLTPDFGFYRMVLDSVGPQSVARGGTSLEAPIREALEGFRDEGNASRLIVLITDGEDHDTHPLDAAKAAAERGIRILAIGFGDEAGSPVYVTDPRTGARVQLRTADGQPVISRLDGDMLRKIALETGGAYVPAGTGVLNLESIYVAHIAPLIRGRLEDQGRLVKREGFQWPLLAAIVCLLAAAIVAGKVTPPPAAITAVLLLACVPAARAADTINPRQVYNEALASLNEGKLDDADKHFLDAREHAGTDAQARFSATYNLGWVEVRRADAVLEKTPEEALDHLERAADWFRDAVRLDPQDKFARENLQILTRRILALADSLRKDDTDDFARRLDELIDRQRTVTASAQSAVERVAALDNPNIPDYLLDEFKGLEAEQRRVLSELDRFMQDAATEIDRLRAIDESKRTPEQSMRFAQLSNMMQYLHDASQRVGQARTQFRERQADRGYRRASAGLDRMKQARDMLRNVVEVLGTLLTEAGATARQTGDLSATTRPAWLTSDYLKEHHEAVVERTDMLFARMDAGRKAGEKQPPKDDTQKKLLERINEAAPLVAEGRDAFREAVEALGAEKGRDAFAADVRGLERLAAARELFLDVRGLIEAMYADERRMAAAVHEESVPFEEYLSLVEKLQDANHKRGERLGQMLDDRLAELNAAATRPAGAGASATQPAGPDQNAEAEKQQYELAKSVLARVMKTFAETDSALHARKADAAKPLIDRGVEQLETLRRLFFSIVEHLKETAQRQTQLADDTRDAATLNDAPAEPLASRQKELSTISRQLADSLRTQSRQQGPTPGAGLGAPQGAAGGQDAAQRLLQAAKSVDQAAGAMDDAAGQLDAHPPDLKKAADPQQTAINKLIEAIALLEPPQPQQQQQQQSQQEQSQGEQQKKEEDKQKQQQQQQMDLRHLLQSVRDRAAQREHDRQRRPAGYQPVEKDW